MASQLERYMSSMSYEITDSNRRFKPGAGAASAPRGGSRTANSEGRTADGAHARVIEAATALSGALP